MPEAEPIRFEQFVQCTQHFQRIFKCAYLQFERCSSGFEFNKRTALNVGLIIQINYYTTNTFDLMRGLWLRDISETNQNFTVLSISLVMFVRGMLVYFRQRQILDLINAFDKTFPLSVELQRLIKLPQYYATFRERFRRLTIFSEFATGMFCLVPMLIFLFRQESDKPVALDHQLLGGWLPFGWKRSYRAYPFVYVYDIMNSLSGVSFLMTWDHMFTIMQQQLCMHLDMIAEQVLSLDANDSNGNFEKRHSFYEHISELITYQRRVNNLGKQFNDVFKISILIADYICAGAICLHIYLMANTSDVFLIVKYTFPLSMLLFFIFDLSMRGAQLEHWSANVHWAIYNHNWYDGSKEYRQMVLLWLQWSNENLKLNGYNMFEVDMMHFTDIMKLAYRLFTFLQSRNN